MSDLSPAAKDAFVGFQRRSISFSREKQKRDSQVTGPPSVWETRSWGVGCGEVGGTPWCPPAEQLTLSP